MIWIKKEKLKLKIKKIQLIISFNILKIERNLFRTKIIKIKILRNKERKNN